MLKLTLSFPKLNWLLAWYRTKHKYKINTTIHILVPVGNSGSDWETKPWGTHQNQVHVECNYFLLYKCPFAHGRRCFLNLFVSLYELLMVFELSNYICFTVDTHPPLMPWQWSTKSAHDSRGDFFVVVLLMPNIVSTLTLAIFQRPNL